MKKSITFITVLFITFLMSGSCKQVASVAPRALADTTVSVNFGGLIVHVFGSTIGERDRAVVLYDNLHPIYLSLPKDIDTARLATVTGLTASSPSGGQVTIGPLPPGFAVRIVGWDPTNKKVVGLMKKPLNPLNTFDKFVPHLQKVSANTLDQWDLRPSLFDSIPDGTYWALFFNLDGGDLSAIPSCKPSKFKADYQGYGSRYFAYSVTLTGKVEGDPAIQFLSKTSSQWETVTLKTVPNKPTFEIVAQPKGGGIGMSHFPKFERLGDPKPGKFDDIFYVDCQNSGLDPSCTNNQWP